VRDPELIAGLLRAALDAIGTIAGPVHPDDVLGLVFSRFCIGK
jgi:tRNA U34 5-carboxymethylaminomethyl modifying GTPase MnmE/TrmE